jgi:AcrR family transcriptional regulator
MARPTARDRLIDSAEKLFAERGIGAVSLRQINLAAGQRNVAATHYHFGSKEGLIEAVIERRMEGINARRLELGEGSGGSDYIRLLARVYGDPRVRIAETFRGKYGQSVLRTEELVHEILGDLPHPIIAMRLGLATGQMIHALADWERHVHSRAGRVSAADTALYVSNLIDSIVGLLRAPLSGETRGELEARRRERARETG